MAGGSLIKREERATAGRFRKNNATSILAPLVGGFGGQYEVGDELEQEKSDEGAWDELANKYEQLGKTSTEAFGRSAQYRYQRAASCPSTNINVKGGMGQTPSHTHILFAKLPTLRGS